MRRMASQGVVMELDWLAVYSGNLSIEDYAAVIRTIGAEHFLISSDLGQAGNPDHVAGLRAFFRALGEAEISEAQIDLMARRNPARLLGLDYAPDTSSPYHPLGLWSRRRQHPR